MKTPLLIGGGALLLLLLMGNCDQNKKADNKPATTQSANQPKPSANDVSSQPNPTTTTPATNVKEESKVTQTEVKPATETSTQTKTDVSNTKVAENVPQLSDLGQSLASTKPSDENTSQKSDPKQLNVNESLIEDRIAYAQAENERQAYSSALQSLRALVNETNNQSAKAKYFLARQYQMMHQNGLKSDSKESFQSLSALHASEAAKLGGKYLEKYPSNQSYASKASSLR